MRKKGAIWIACAAAVIACAFLLPHLLLRAEQHEMEDYSDRYDAGELNGESLTLPEKLMLLAQDSGYFVQGDDGADFSPDEITEQFFQELNALTASGAIPFDLRQLFYEGNITVERYLLVYGYGMENRMFSYYTLYSDAMAGGLLAHFDEESGKILRISVYAPEAASRLTAALAAEEDESRQDGSSYLAGQLKAWAKYYGLSMRDVVAYDSGREWEYEYPTEYGAVLCLTGGVFYDETGSAGFGILYIQDGSVLVWGAVYEDVTKGIAEKLADGTVDEAVQ